MLGGTLLLHVRDMESAGLMKGVDDRGNLQVESSLQISAGTPVRIECQGDFCAIGDAMYCRAAGDLFLIGLRIRSDRRSEPRFETSGSAVIEELCRPEEGGVLAEILHLSLSGAGLIADRPYRSGALVRIEADSWFRFAEIRHSTRSDDGTYYVGVVFLTGCFTRTPQR